MYFGTDGEMSPVNNRFGHPLDYELSDETLDKYRELRALEDTLYTSEKQRWELFGAMQANASLLLGGHANWATWDFDTGNVIYGDSGAPHLLHPVELGEITSGLPIQITDVIPTGNAVVDADAMAQLQMCNMFASVVADPAGTQWGVLSVKTTHPFATGVDAVTTYYRIIPNSEIASVSDRISRFMRPPKVPVAARNGKQNGQQMESVISALAGIRDVIDAALEDLYREAGQ